MNDLLLLQQACAGDAGCIQAGLLPVLQGVGTSFGAALASLRAAYDGEIVVPTYYVPFPIESPLSVVAISYLNATLAAVAAPFDAEVADVQQAFEVASAPFGGSPCAAGLLIPDGATCDQHPSEAGQRLIAATVAKVVLGE